jgi:hypothetical protein
VKDLERRRVGTEATLAKYRLRPFDWASAATCIHLARSQARNLGHRPPAIPRFRSAVGARTALAAQGHGTLEALLDSLFPRIAPAAMLLGDLAALPGEGPFPAIMIFDGGAKLLGWHGADPSGIKPVARAMGEIVGAWRL